MNSKEAVLELICEAKSTNIDEGRICFLRNIIEKDLDRLEELENQNQELKDKLNLGDSLCSGFWHNDKQVVLCTLEHYDDIMTENIRLEKAIKKAIELLSIDGKGTKKQVLNLLKEVLENDN